MQQVIANKYRLGDIIYTSDLTWVYEATFAGSSREAKEIPLIVKTIPRMRLDEAQTKLLKERVRSEAQALSNLDNPFIVKSIDLVEEATIPFLVMRRRSMNLSQYLQTKGKLSLVAAVPLLYTLATALDYAHSQGFIHRDLKPDNILLDLDAKGQALYAYITDFGIAHFQERRIRTETNQLMGTMAYMPPERWEGKETTKLSDVYSFGLVAYEMLTAQPLFKSDAVQAQINNIMNPSSEFMQGIKARLDPDVALIVLKAISRNPQDRYEDATSFADSLGKLLPASALDKVNHSIALSQAEAGRADERALNLISEKHNRFPVLTLALAALSCFVIGMLWYQFLPATVQAETSTATSPMIEITEEASPVVAFVPSETASSTAEPSSTASMTASPSASPTVPASPSASNTARPSFTPSPTLTPSTGPTPLPEDDCEGAGWVYHEVNPNDTLSHYGTSLISEPAFAGLSYAERIALIRHVNIKVDFSNLPIGESVCLPASPPQQASIAAATATEIVIGGTDGSATSGGSADSASSSASSGSSSGTSGGSSGSSGGTGTTDPTSPPPPPPPPSINVSVSASCGNGNSGQTTFRVSNNGSSAVSISWRVMEGSTQIDSGSLSLNAGQSSDAWSGNTRRKNYSLLVNETGASSGENCGN